ncbi:hypothetical protein [Streptomyces sediminimaris]|uniref:hypothetical protein n=1 Tax=Streptomyces sediminimaris TaxID=3383721 RepID=UPI00399968CD
MIADVIDTLTVLGWAYLTWLVILAAVATLVLYAVIAILAAAVRGLRKLARWAHRGRTRPAWARGRVQARRFTRARRDYEEAA